MSDPEFELHVHDSMISGRSAKESSLVIVFQFFVVVCYKFMKNLGMLYLIF